MLDANQIWDVGEAIEWMQKLSRFNPLWIEEPTNPDDVVGHQTISKGIQPIGVAKVRWDRIESCLNSCFN